jgi:ferric-dicitrate binding protein FerR (iron transport regulator)
MDIEKIRSYLKGLESGTLTHEEEAWIQQFLENATQEELMQVFPQEEWDVQETKAVSRERLDLVYKDIASHITTVVKKPVQWWRKPAVQVTAAAAVVLTFVVTLLSDKSGLLPAAEQPVVEWKTVATLAGEHLVVRLPDNTEIYVNGSTTLQYPELFAENAREIRLDEGEIFVDVARDAARPFRVVSQDIAINVLGTSFNVRNYSSEPIADIAVKTGRIAVSNRNITDGVLVTAGKRAVITKKSGKLSLSANGHIPVNGWIQNELVFSDMAMKDVFTYLYYNRGLKFEVHDSTILDKHVKASFRHKTGGEIVHLLSKMAQFNYDMKDSLVIIH